MTIPFSVAPVPRTSVIVPARNATATLDRALGSLLSQTDGDWEAILIDDQSTDGTAAAIAAIAARDPRFVALQGPGRGASGARNVGLAAARGRRVLFLDSDDWIDDRLLEVMHAAIDATPGAVAAYCDHRRVMPDGSETPVYSNPEIAVAPFWAFARSCATAIHSILIDRTVLSRAGEFDLSLRTCEDWDLWQRAASLGGAWVHVDQTLSFYRLSENSLSQDVRQMLDDARTVIARGFARPQHAAGVAALQAVGGVAVWDATAVQAHTYFALWCAAFDCGRGGTGEVVTEDFSVLPKTTDAVRPIVQALLDGVSVGMRAVPRQLAARWAAFGPGIARVVERLGVAWGDPVAARRIQYQLERLVLEYDDLAAVRTLSLTTGLRVDLHRPADVTPAAGIDRLYVYLCDGDAVKAIVDVGVLGTVLRQDWLALARAHVSHELIDPRAGVDLRSVLAPAALRSAVRTGLRASRQAAWGDGVLRSARRVAQEAFIAAAASPYPPDSHVARLEAIRASAAVAPPAPVASDDTDAPVIAAPLGEDRKAYWEQLFQQADPWRYGNDYEQEKYVRQLSLLPSGPIGRGFELACAEGHFTQSLAPRVESLIATDISVTALERAQARCEGHRNITFRQFDLVADTLPSDLDLLVCSEVLYYLENAEVLAQVATRFAAALKPGGHLLTAHAFVLQDDSTRSGFDWGHQWGGETIARAFAATPGLALEQSVQTELYRIDRFVRVADGAEAPTPIVEHAVISGELDAEVERHVIWGGATARRTVLKVTEQHDRIPVLMYHSVAPEGPSALARWRVTPDAFRSQMRWLRHHGYHTISSEELQWFLENRHPFVGRPVVITFDDGLQTFADHAWPLLRRSDMGAEVFVVTDLVGQTARWEADPRDATPLMDEATIVRLGGEGVVFGSHLATHRGADALPTQVLADELLRSRATLQRWLGRSVDALAAPFGLTDGRLRRLASECGYRVCYSTVDTAATLEADPLHVPRIEVHGDWSLEQFASRMEESR